MFVFKIVYFILCEQKRTWLCINTFKLRYLYIFSFFFAKLRTMTYFFEVLMSSAMFGQLAILFYAIRQTIGVD